MIKIITRLLLLFIYPIIVFLVLRLIFMGFYSSVIGISGISDVIETLFHGLRMDMSMAGYLTVIPAIMTLISVRTSSKKLRKISFIYYAIISAIISAVFLIDLILYDYWGFRLDMTPIFYFTTSPVAALASAEIWMIAVGLLTWIILGIIIYRGYMVVTSAVVIKSDRSAGTTIVGILATALLFLPIRGGITVSTMNPSFAYFSNNMRLNHAAINPMFSLIYSATHQSGYEDQYHFMSDRIAGETLYALDSPLPTDSVVMPILKCLRPDIYMIILESFSTHLMPSTGGYDVASGLDSIARDGILFPNIYASSFRTDRALPAILSAVPAQPSTSVLKYVNKIEHLPSLPRALSNEGYSTEYYYGGDANFTNMNAFLVSLGFEKIISDKDFSIPDKTSKWGAHDGVLFQRVLSDIREGNDTSRYLRVIQTSSSHEPYKVPYCDPRFADNERLNAFAYTDSCLTSFINELSKSADWDSTLIIIVPDHWGVWPQNPEEMPERHRIPVVFTGGAIANHGVEINRIGQQTDIAATLLSAMGIDSDEDFRFSRNLLDPGLSEYAFFSRPSIITLLTPDGRAEVDCDSGHIIQAVGEDSIHIATAAKAYLQTLYRYLSEL